MTEIDLEAVSSIASFLVILYVLGIILNYMQAYIFSTSIQHFSKRLRTAIAEKSIACHLHTLTVILKGIPFLV